MLEAFIHLPATERVARTLKAKAEGVPLTDRWKQLDLPVSVDWLPRARHAAMWLSDAGSVADLGCGNMLLETCLRPDQAYRPVDFIARDGRTVVVDCNTQPLPPLDATHFAALGLLEYLYDLEGFLVSLKANFAGGVASFFTRRDVSELDRLANGWVNHQTESEIRELFGRSGFTITRALEFEPAHLLFRLD